MLKTKIQTCNAVVHLAGFYYGAEPQPVIPGPDRRSFTQMEYEIAVELKLPCYVFLCGKDFPFDKHDPEPEDKQQLQLDHRERLLKRDELFYEFASPEELANRTRELQLSVEGLRKELAKERNRRRLAMIAAVAALFIAVVGGIWMHGRQKEQEAVNVTQSSEIASLKAQLEGPWLIVNKVNAAMELMRQQSKGTEEEMKAAAIKLVAADVKKTPEEVKQAIDSATQLAEKLIAAARAEGEGDATKKAESRRLEAETLMKLAASHEAAANYKEALSAFTKAFELLDPKTQPEEWLDALCSIAEMEREIGNGAGSGEKLQQAVEFGETNPALGIGHRLTIFATSSLASYLIYTKEDLPAAEKLLRRVVKERKASLGEDSPETLRAMGDLSEVLASEEKYEEAADINVKALETSERVFGPDGDVTMDIVDNLSNVFDEMDDLDEAIKLKRRVLAFNEKKYGPEDEVALTGANVLANMLKKNGDIKEAGEIYNNVLETREKTLGPEHPDTLSSMESVAGILSSEEDYAGAEKLCRSVLAVREKVQGPDHPDTVDTVDGLALLRWNQDDLPGAEKLYRRVLTAKERTLGPEDPKTIQSVSDVALMLELQKEYAEAEPLYRRVLEARESTLKKSDPEIADACYQVALMLSSQDKDEEALPLAKRAVSIAEESLPDDDKKLASYKELLEQVTGSGGNFPDGAKPREATTTE